MRWVAVSRFSACMVLSLVACTSSYDAGAQQVPEDKAVVENAAGDAKMPALPPPPKGRATVMGGSIRSLDPVRDQFSLKVSGGGSVKILFDERTQVFRDGVKLPLRELRPADHASVETVLDGTNVYALSVHVLSAAPEGDIQGQVINYDQGGSLMTVESRLSNQPLRLHVAASTPVTCVGQVSTSSCSSLSSITKGTLVSVKFQSDNSGRGVATEIGILATPGASYVLTGELTALDVPAGLLVVMDPRDSKQYSVQFDAAQFPMVRDLHEGAKVDVTANFDGTRYTATALKVR